MESELTPESGEYLKACVVPDGIKTKSRDVAVDPRGVFFCILGFISIKSFCEKKRKKLLAAAADRKCDLIQ